MNKNLTFIIALLSMIFLPLPAISHNELQTETPSHVEIIKQDGKFSLLVNGSPFTIKGAGLSEADGTNYQGLVDAGGNAFRTWSTKYANTAFAAAKKHNLMVALGVGVEKELGGFDYNDEVAVKKQIAWAKKQIDQYKNHPNLLVWVVSNEPNLLIDEQGQLADVNPKVYDTISILIDYIHEVDPHHPVTYTFAGLTQKHYDVALARTPQVDFVSMQVYGDLANINKHARSLTGGKPFMVTEYGAMGHWERPSTKWGREIEEPSAVKAASMVERINKGLITNDTGLNIGSFVFLWGQKQERTPTWYGLYNADGKADARIDEMTKIWTGNYPDNRAPLVTEITLNNKHAIDSVYLTANSTAHVKVLATDPNNDTLRYKWVILSEVIERSEGGHKEKEPGSIGFTQLESKTTSSGGEMQFTVPKQAGEYRLFAYVYDGKGKVGNANIPFFVNK